MAKSKAAPTDFSGLIKDEASLKRANDLHAQKIPLLEKAANIREKIAEVTLLIDGLRKSQLAK